MHDPNCNCEEQSPNTTYAESGIVEGIIDDPCTCPVDTRTDEQKHIDAYEARNGPIDYSHWWG